MRSIQSCKDNLEGLEEELEGPSQELEEKKREERRRLKKVEDLQKEIQVFVWCWCVCFCTHLSVDSHLVVTTLHLVRIISTMIN